jgi:hypothetical protein
VVPGLRWRRLSRRPDPGFDHPVMFQFRSTGCLLSIVLSIVLTIALNMCIRIL